MSPSPAVPGPATPGDDRLADLRTLGEQLPRFVRLVHALKAGQVRAEREAHLARVTADWPAADLSALTHLFGRLLDDLAASLPTEPVPAPVAAPSREKS